MKEHTTCRTCLVLRPFLAVAGTLIVLIWLRPDGLVAAAGLVPGTNAIAATLMSVGLAVFGLRYLDYRRSESGRAR